VPWHFAGPSAIAIVRRALSTLAIAYTYQGLYSKALQQNLEALRIREELHLDIPSLQSLNTIGTLYHHTGQYAKAIEYYQRVEASLAQRPDTIRLLILARLNIGFAEYRRGNYLVALAAAEKALPITRRAKNGTLAYAALIGGQTATDLRRYAQARQLLQLSHDEYPAQGQKHGLVQVHNAMGRLELATGATARDIATLKESATLAVEIRARDELKSSYELLARAYERQGNTAEAYRYFRQFIAVRDSIYNSEENGRLADISMQIVTLQKDNEIRSLKQERVINALQLSNQRYLSAVLVVLVVSLASLMAIQLRHSRKRRQINEQLRAKNAELGRLNAELALRLHEIKHLSGLLPMCAWCKNIRDDDGYWQQVEEYLGKRTDAQFSHGICPPCAEKLAREG
jgi:tetratricopeptide (TPR) repeat protein